MFGRLYGDAHQTGNVFQATSNARDTAGYPYGTRTKGKTMDDAAGRTAASASGTAADRQALAELVFGWGKAYVIGREGGCWHAGRRDSPGHLLTARDPEELRAAIRADYELKPVPRDPGVGNGKL